MIVVCGEALIDLFVGPAEGAEMPARAVAGGSPFNVAIGLARLGVDVAFLGGISRDRFGALLASTLVREGVDDRFLVRTDRLSTISMVATDDNGQPSYAFHGERAADRSFALTNLPAELPPDVQALTFGSYTMAVEPVGSAFAALAERECGRRVISVDPNLRPAVVGDVERWATAAERLYRTATIIKASDEDMRRLGRPRVGRGSRRLLARLRRAPGGGDRGSERGDGVLRHRSSFGAHPFSCRARYSRCWRHVSRRAAGPACENRQALS